MKAPFDKSLASIIAAALLVLLSIGLFRFIAVPRKTSPPISSSEASAPPPPKPYVYAGDPAPAWANRIAEAGKRDFAGLLTEALRITDEAERSRVIAALLARWIHCDVKGLMAFLDAHSVNEQGEAMWRIVGPALAEALTHLDQRDAALPALKGLVRRLVAYLAKTDPDGALAWAREWLRDDTHDLALARIVPELAKTDPSAAIRVLAEIHQPARRVDALAGLGAIFGSSDPDQAVRWAASLAASAERPYAMSSVLGAMAENDPVEAAREFSAFRNTMTSEYAAQLAADRSALSRSAADQVEGDPSNREADPYPVNPQLHLLNDAAAAIAENWAVSDPTAAFNWIANLPDGRMKRDAVESALSGWAGVDGSAAFAWYAANSGVADASAAETLFRSWAASDVAGALAQAAAIGDDSIRANALTGAVDGWISSGADPALVRNWVGTLPSGPARDAADAQIVDALSLDSPKQAWQLALTIADPGQQKGALESSFASFVESDPDAARVALAAAKLPTDLSNGLQQMIDAVSDPVPN